MGLFDLSASYKITKPIAIKGGKGTVVITPSGGTGPYQIVGLATNPKNEVLLEAGRYYCVINDSNQKRTTLSFTLTEPEEFKLKFSTDNSSVVNLGGQYTFKTHGAKAKITIIATGGTPPYKYNNGSKNVFELAAGNHTISVTDKYNNEAKIVINLAEPDEFKCEFKIDSSALVTDADKIRGEDTLKVKGGKAKVTFTASGGHEPYKYNSGDDKEIDIHAGTHNIKVTDQYGNEKTIQIILAEPEEFVVTKSFTDLADEKIDSHPAVKKNGGTAKVKFTAKGGFSPYKYKGTDVDEIELGAGDHKILIEDKYGLKLELEIKIREPKALTIKHSFDDKIATDKINNKVALKSNGAKATVTIEVAEGGGFAPYTFYEGDVEVNPPPGDKKHDFIVGAGKHEFKVKDKYGDEKSETVDLAEPEILECKKIEIEPAKLVDDVDKINDLPTLKKRGGSAEVTLTPKGGHKPYKFNGSNEGDSWKFDQSAVVNKEIKVTDKYGNEVIVEIKIAQAEPLTVISEMKNPFQISGVNAVAEFGGEAEVSFDVKGGFPKFEAELNGFYKVSLNRSFDDSFKAGDHTVTVKDKYDNTAEVKFKLVEPDDLMISYTLINPVKVPGGKAEIKIECKGGVDPLTGPDPNKSYYRAAGFHEFVVTDNKGVQKTMKIEIIDAVTVKKIIRKNVITPGSVGQCSYIKRGAQANVANDKKQKCDVPSGGAVLTFKHKMLNKKSGATSVSGKGAAIMQTKYDKAAVQGTGDNKQKVSREALKTENVYKELEKAYEIDIGASTSPAKTYVFEITAGKYTNITDHKDSLVHFTLKAEGPSCDKHKGSGGRVFEITDNGIDRGRPPKSTDEENQICISMIDELSDKKVEGKLRSPFSVDFFGEKDAQGKKVGKNFIKKFWDDLSLKHNPAEVLLSLNKCDMAETKVIFKIYPAIKWQVKGTYDFGNGERYSSVDAETKDVDANIAGSTSGISLISTYGTHELEYAFNTEDWFFGQGGESSYLDSLMNWCLQISNGIKGFVVFPKVELTGEWGWDWNQDPPTTPPTDTYTVTKVKKYGKFIANLDPLFGLKFRINLLKASPVGWVLEALSWVKKLTAGYVAIDFGIDIYADSIVSVNFELQFGKRDADEWKYQFDFSLLKIVVGICAYAKAKLNFIIIKISGALSADLATGLAFGCPPADQRQTSAWIDIDFLGVKGTFLASGEIGLGMFKNTDRPDKSQTIDGYTDNAKGDNDENLDGKRGGINRKARKKKEVLLIQPFHLVRWQMKD